MTKRAVEHDGPVVGQDDPAPAVHAAVDEGANVSNSSHAGVYVLQNGSPRVDDDAALHRGTARLLLITIVSRCPIDAAARLTWPYMVQGSAGPGPAHNHMLRLDPEEVIFGSAIRLNHVSSAALHRVRKRAHCRESRCIHSVSAFRIR